MTTLTLSHLRFDLTARATIKLGRANAGERLRNALASVMLRAVCPERERGRLPTPEHAAACPACWLLAAEVDPGEVRRAYALAPQLPPRDIVEAGERFAFVLTLYGSGLDFLPYFLLAAAQMGESGVGPGRGKFELHAVRAGNPLARLWEPVVSPGATALTFPRQPVRWEEACAVAEQVGQRLEGRTLPVDFLTATRLIEDGALVKSPDFGVLFQRLLHRIDQLAQQFAGAEQRPLVERERLQAMADRVRMVESNTQWVELWGWSGRTKRKSPMGGFTGRAAYRSQDWEELLPWLLLGQGVQVGKLTVKGNGLFESALPGESGYWRWLFA